MVRDICDAHDRYQNRFTVIRRNSSQLIDLYRKFTSFFETQDSNSCNNLILLDNLRVAADKTPYPPLQKALLTSFGLLVFHRHE